MILLLGLVLGSPGAAVARDWLVPEQAPTIQAAIDSCVQGDVVVISPGTYNDCTHLSENVVHIAVMKSGVNLRGATGDPDDVVLDAEGVGRVLELRNLTGTIEVEAVTIRRGRTVNPFGSGGGAFAYQTDVIFRQCVFDSNHADYAGGAVCSLYGDLTLEDCRLIGNESPLLGAAIRVSNAPTVITGTTIHGSIGEAIHYTNCDLTLENCLITGSSEQAIVRNTTGDPEPALSCTDLFDNDEDWSDFFADQADSNGNLSVDPQYCNPVFGDLHLYASSPCAAENNTGCGRIGMLPVGCGTGAAVHLVRADGLGDFPTIQDAIDAAAISDTVSLADGVFTGPGNRDLDFLGKAITVMGRSGDAALAVIDCQGSSADPHRGFHFHHGEGSFAVLRDVTITNADVAGDGAAILCESSPSIIDCVLRQNHADRGAAIFCAGGSPVIDGCLVTQNEGRSQAGGLGFHGSDALVRNCTIVANWGAMGAALFLPDSSSVTVEGSTLSGNNCALDRGMVTVRGNSELVVARSILSYGNQHAVRCYDTGSITLTDCDVFGNALSDYSLCVALERNRDGNISADPRYCDAAAGDFSLRSDSPCSADNAWSGQQVGAHGVGCDAPSVFADVSGALAAIPAESGGAVWTDIDADGHLDAFVVNSWSANEVLLGDGAGGFVPFDNMVLRFGGSAVTGLWNDWDRDGDRDLYLGNMNLPNFLADNQDGEFVFLDAGAIQHIGPAGGSAWLDFDDDGVMDLFIAATDSTSRLLRGDGAGGFVIAGGLAAIGTAGVQQVAIADYDNDGDQDLYLVQDGAANLLLEYDGIFEAVLPGGDQAYDGAGRSAAWGDYDNDGDLDLYLVNDGEANLLLRNRGGAGLDDVSGGAWADAGPGRSGLWGDWDNDGDLDLFVTNCGAADRLLRNEGDGLFVDVGENAFAAADSSTGAAWGDYDEDGDLDLLVADGTGATRLYRNDQATGNHWLKIDLVHYTGSPGCPGARVRVVTGDTVRIREADASRGWLSQDSPTIHFGLGAATTIDTLEVTMAGCRWAVLTDVPADQSLTLTAVAGTPVAQEEPPAPLIAAGIHSCYPNPFNPTVTIGFGLPRAGNVSLKVYDVAGRLVRTLVDEPLPAGLRQAVWNGRDGSGRGVASGVYAVRLESGALRETRRVVLLK